MFAHNRQKIATMELDVFEILVNNRQKYYKILAENADIGNYRCYYCCCSSCNLTACCCSSSSC